MKKFILSFLMVLFSVCSYSQEIIECNNDTAVIITPENLKTINSIIINYEFTIKELDLYKKIHKIDSVLITTKDSIILNKDYILEKKDLFYSESLKNITISLENEKRKHQRTKYFLGSTGVIAVILGIILCGQ